MSQCSTARAPCTVMLFTGQGSQYGNMSRGLHDASGAYRHLLEDAAARADRVLGPGRPLLARMFSDPASDRHPEALNTDHAAAQMGLFVQEYATARMWLDAGLRCTAVIGQSLGEYAAACIAGILELDEAIEMLAARTRAMESKCAVPSGMVAVMASPSKVQEGLDASGGALADAGAWISVVNTASSVVVSGTLASLARFEAWCADEGLLHSRLPTKEAFHSPLLASAAADFRERLRRIPRSARTCSAAFVSTVGHWAGQVLSTQACDTDYWVSHVLEPVDFSKASRTLLDIRPDVVLEVGPQPVLTHLARANTSGALPDVRWIHSLHRRADDVRTVSMARDALHAMGCLSSDAAAGLLNGGAADRLDGPSRSAESRRLPHGDQPHPRKDTGYASTS